MIKDFFRTIRSYTLGERLVSAILAVIFLVSTLALFSRDGVSDKDAYVEGAVGRIFVLNPLLNVNELDRDVSQLLFSGLMRYDAEKGKMVEDLAKFTLNESQTIYTFTLKDNLYFHNGNPITADDVFFTFHDLIQSEEFSNSILKANFGGVSIIKKDTKTVQFELDHPNSFFTANMSVGILPKAVYGEIPVGEIFTHEINKRPVGSGPYEIRDEYVINSRGDGKLTLRRFETYHAGVPNIETIVYKTYTTVDRLLANIAEVDAVGKVSGEMIGELDDASMKLQPYQLPQYKAAFFNTSSGFLKERSVRLALLKSVNKDELLKLLPHKTKVDTPLMDLDQQQWVNRVSVEEAHGALFDAGYKYNDPKKKGVRKNKKGTPLTVKLVYFQRADKDKSENEDEIMAQFLKKAWGEIGVGVEIVVHPAESRTEVVSTRAYDVLLTGESLGYDLDTYFFWHSSQAIESGSNLSNYRNFSADALIEDIRRYVDEGRKKKRLPQLAQIIQGDIPAIFLYRPTYFYATREKFAGYKLNRLAFPADRFYNIQLWSHVK